jgi:putative serine/threonine protein kinase
MAGEIRRKDTALDEAIPLEVAKEAICFPRPETDFCNKLIDALTRHGITHYVNKGNLRIGKLMLLGKGCASNVFLALMGERIVAVKALRPGSRRISLLHEAAILITASIINISPQVYSYDNLFIAMEYIKGRHLDEALDSCSNTAKTILVMRRLLWKAFLLDILGISHNELARPHRQVIVEDNTLEPYIIDFESATVSRRPSNLTQLVGGILRSKVLSRKICVKDIDEEIKTLLKQYKNETRLKRRANIAINIIDTLTCMNK